MRTCDRSTRAVEPAVPDVPGLQRDRLLELIRRPTRLTLVVAPAGSGKTTLLTQYARTCPTPVIWHHTDRLDVDPTRLAGGLAHALRGAGPTVADVYGLVELVEKAGPSTLLIDDVHLLRDSPSEPFVEDLLVRAPASLSVVLASRQTPGLNLCQVELGTLGLVTADDLRFRSWEVEALFREIYREPLPPDDVAVLTRRTDGWAACLQLFHLSTQARPLADRRRSVRALSGGPRFARAYLIRTILDTVPAELRTFLARTAVFEVLTAQRCDRLLGSTDAHLRLTELERLEVLTAVEDGWATDPRFRYHEVLHRHLESTLLDELGPDRTRAWYTEAAVLLEQEGTPDEALRAYLRAERWDEAARLLRDDGACVLAAGPGHTWRDLLPAQLVEDDPWLGMVVARRLVAEGRLREAVGRYRRAESLFPDAADRHRAAEERRLVELWTGGSPQPHLHWLDRLRAAARRHPGRFGPEHPTSAPGELLCGAVTALLSGDLTAAGSVLPELLSYTDIDGPTALAARLVQVAVDLAAGADVTASVDRLATDADRAGASWVARQARMLDGLRAADAAQLRRVLAECERADDTWGALLVRGADALRALLAGEPSAATWMDVARRCRAADAGTFEAWARVGAALAAAAEGAPDAVPQARAAESFVRTAGVWGAQALGVLAQAAAGPATARTAATEQARTLARSHGLPWPRRLADTLLGGPTPPIEVAAPAVRLRCLGGFDLRIGDRPPDWTGVRPRAATALRILAAHTPRPVHLDTLLQLWPDRTGDRARHSLQVAVSSLRSALVPGSPRGPGRMVERRGEAYALVLPAGSTADVEIFADELRAAELARADRDDEAERAALVAALAAYGGDLLPGDGPADWAVELRDRLRLQATAAAARLAESALARDDPAGAIDAARRCLAIDPFWDAAWRALLTAHARTGDTAAAARTRRDYTEVLAELGVEGTA